MIAATARALVPPRLIASATPRMTSAHRIVLPVLTPIPRKADRYGPAPYATLAIVTSSATRYTQPVIQAQRRPHSRLAHG